MGLGLPDQIPDGRGSHKYFVGGNSALFVSPFDQYLGYDADQVKRDLHSNLILLVRGEDVNDAVNG